ncbi:ubiquinol-cytochrome c reductase iron-sulfur subunit [Tamaricihabitans halophyticus]|nr:Rieske (2Fe-2S) protein [Tamaricihabitans halophyticus]
MTAELTNRRTALATGALAIGAVAAVAACDTEDGADSAPAGTTGAAPEPGDGALAQLGDIEVGGAIKTEGADGAEIIISRPSETEVVAFSATCTHQGCKVQPEEAELHCPCHGSAFDKQTGAVRNGPATEPLPEVAVRIDGERVVPA